MPYIPPPYMPPIPIPPYPFMPIPPYPPPYPIPILLPKPPPYMLDPFVLLPNVEPTVDCVLVRPESGKVSGAQQSVLDYYKFEALFPSVEDKPGIL